MGQFDIDAWRDRPRKTADGLAWIEAGRRGAPLVVLIHGVGLRAESWGRQILDLSLKYHVLAVDMPGHGGSEPFDHRPRLADYTDRIAAWISTLGAPAVVAGHSMGALISLDLVTRHAGLVAGAAPCNAVYRRSAEAGEAVRARAASLASDPDMDVTSPLPRWFPGPATFEAEREACRRWLTSAARPSYAAAYTAFAEEDGPPVAGLAAIRCPVTYLTGALEPNSTPAMSRAMAALTPDAEAVIVDGSYHMTPMTHPDETTAALLRLLDRAGFANGAGPRNRRGQEFPQGDFLGDKT